MKICDKCAGIELATKSILFVEDDVRYDLCEKHCNEAKEFVCDKGEKKTIFGRKKKDSARKAG
jgi:hypothetical protein